VVEVEVAVVVKISLLDWQCHRLGSFGISRIVLAMRLLINNRLLRKPQRWHLRCTVTVGVVD